MINTTRLRQLSLAFLYLTVSAKSITAFAQNEPPGTAPCWLESPAENGPLGQIGVSKSIAVGKYSPEQISQLRAIDALCHGLKNANCSDQIIQHALEQSTLNGQALHFAFHRVDGYIYSYAGFAPVSEDNCALNQCDIGSCNPEWLCNPSSSNSDGVMGVSYQATSAFEQYKSAIGNGLLQAEYMYGVNIKASKQLRSASSGLSSYRFLSEASIIDDTGHQNVPYYLAHQCRNQSSLYTHIILNKEKSKTSTPVPSNTDWIGDPKQNGIDGAVGAVENMVASGLLSDQIELAIERAAVQLAFEKYSKVTEQALQIVRSNGGIIRISNITENTQVDLKARVLKIHFDQKPGSQTKVYVWLAVVD